MKNAHNIRKAWIIVLLFILFSTTLGFVIGKLFDIGVAGAVFMFTLASLYTGFAYFFSDRLILRSLNAHRINHEINAQLYKKMHQIASEMSLVTPELYFIDSSTVNIFSLGRNERHAKIILTTGLIDHLTTPETEAVFSHELAHIKATDTLIGSLTATIVGFFPFYAEYFRRKNRLFSPLSLIFSLFSLPTALLMHLTLSPKREFEADAAGVLETRYPEGLSTALEKIGSQQHTLKHMLNSTAHLWIVSPLQIRPPKSTGALFLTHPTLEERLNILQSL